MHRNHACLAMSPSITGCAAGHVQIGIQYCVCKVLATCLTISKHTYKVSMYKSKTCMVSYISFKIQQE